MSSANEDSAAMSTATLCKNRQYTSSMKTTFQFINLGFSLFVCILMVVVCFSFSNNVKMIQDVPFIVQTISFEAGGVQDEACYYMGMRGMCFAVCGAVSAFYPVDSTYRDCNQQSSISYSQQVSACNEQPAEIQNGDACLAAYSCNTGGTVCMIFALLAIACAGWSLYYTHLRMTADCQSYKAYSIIWSLSTFACCLTSYLSMQACARKTNDTTAALFDPNEQYTNLSVSTAPGVSGIMSIFGFTVFAYVFILNLHMPALTIDDDLTEPLYSDSSADK